MSGEIRLPSLGADMEAATLVEWRIEPGRDPPRSRCSKLSSGKKFAASGVVNGFCV